MIFILKCRRETLGVHWRREPVFREQTQLRESEVLESHLTVDRVHLLLSVLPKYSVARVAAEIGLTGL